MKLIIHDFMNYYGLGMFKALPLNELEKNPNKAIVLYDRLKRIVDAK